MGRFDKLEIPGKKPSNQPSDGSDHRPIYNIAQFMDSAESNYWEGDFEESLRYYSKALREDPSLEIAWQNQVKCLLKLGEYEEALLWVDKALDKFVNSPELLAVKAVSLARMKQFKLAREFSDAALNARINSPYIWIARGDAIMKINPKNAERCLNKAMEIISDDWKIRFEIGEVYWSNKYYRKALQFFLNISEVLHDNARLWLLIGNCRMHLGYRNYNDAYQQALQLKPNWEYALKFIRLSKPSIIKLVWRRLSRWK